MQAHARRVKRRDLLAAAIGALATGAMAQGLERRVTVRLGEPGMAHSFEDGIVEYEAVVYVLALRAGQACRISLASNNAANCFDIHTAGSAKPLFAGSESGNDHTLVAHTSGDFMVRVYLLRFAARDGQSARYALEFMRTA